jgi:hypothetical protein
MTICQKYIDICGFDPSDSYNLGLEIWNDPHWPKRLWTGSVTALYDNFDHKLIVFFTWLCHSQIWHSFQPQFQNDVSLLILHGLGGVGHCYAWHVRVQSGLFVVNWRWHRDTGLFTPNLLENHSFSVATATSWACHTQCCETVGNSFIYHVFMWISFCIEDK